MFRSVHPKFQAIALVVLVLPAIIAATLLPTSTASAAGLRGRAANAPKSTYGSNPDLKATLRGSIAAPSIAISGNDFPPGGGVKLAFMFSDGSMTWIKGTKANPDGSFDVTRSLGGYRAGTTLRVLALGKGGFKQGSNSVTLAP